MAAGPGGAGRSPMGLYGFHQSRGLPEGRAESPDPRASLLGVEEVQP